MAQVATKRLEAPTFTEPADLPPTATKMQLKKWEIEYDKYHKDEMVWEVVKNRTYQMLLLHCYPYIEEKMLALDDWDDINEKQDLSRLLKAIRSIVHTQK